MYNKCLRIILVMGLALIVFQTAVFSQEEAYLQPSSKWMPRNDGITYIPVCWENANGYAAETSWVRTAIENTWEYYANVDFQGWGTCYSNSSGIRIRVIDNRSNVKVLGRFLDGMANGMDLNFTFYNFDQKCQSTRRYCISAIAVHEFGHALGLAHEQDQPTSLCFKERTVRANALAVTPYDADSVMNYCNDKWSESKLSYYDIRGIQAIYGSKAAPVNKHGTISVFDELGSDQVWEEVVISLGNSEQRLVLGRSAPKKTASWNFTVSGTYCFKFSTRALHTNGYVYTGRGEKCYSLTGGTNYRSLELTRGDWNNTGYYTLLLK